jgi:decaprenyl-phosphate phosphoribosyltransferase
MAAATTTVQPAAGRRYATAAGWLRAVRPEHWVKNVVVLSAPAAATVLDQPAVMARTLAAVAAFVLASAGTYLINDACDAAADRLHPRKRLRPVAAGEISTRAAATAGVVACVLAAAGAVLLSRQFGLVVCAYLLLTTAYSWRLKQVEVLEMMLVASGFLLRAIGGGVVNHLPLSRWFLLVSAAGALFLVSGKRLAEQRALGEDATAHRPVSLRYPAEWIQQTMTMTLTATVLGYCLWAFQYLGRDILQVLLAISVAPFTAAMLRYAQLVSQGHGQQPERHLVTDPFLVSAVLCCALLLFCGLYAV